MGTKQVIHTTRELGWGSDTRIYTDFSQFRDEFPRNLAAGGPRVLKQYRGNGGNGVWKVESSGLSSSTPGNESPVKVLHALRGSVQQEMTLAELTALCEAYFAGDGRIIDQAFQPRLADGMIRCYLAEGRVVGFGHQFVTALLQPPGSLEPPAAPPRFYFGPGKPEFQALKQKLESGWVAEMQRLCGVDEDSLPAIWDADFLYGPKTASGEDSYVLCEVNVSSVFPVPEEAFDEIAASAVRRVVRSKQARAQARSRREGTR
jgi:hypothetical protein